MFKKLFSHTAIYGIAPQVALLVNFLLLPFITPKLSQVDFGVAGTVLAYTGSIAALSTLGLRVILTNTFYKNKYRFKIIWRQLLGFLSLWNIIYSLLIGIVVYLIIPTVAVENLWTIVLLHSVPSMLFGQLNIIGRTFYQLNSRPLPIAIRSLVFGLLTAGLNYLFIAQYNMGYMGWFWTTSIVLVVNHLSYIYPLFFKLNLTPIFSFKWRLIKSSLTISLPTIPHTYGAYLLNSSDRIVMDAVNVSTDDIGKYNVANTFGALADGFSSAVGWAISPILTKAYSEKKWTESRNLIFKTQLLFFTVTFLPCLWLKEIFALFIKNDSLNSYYGLGIILIMSVNYRPMYFANTMKMLFYEKTAKLWRITFVGGIINVISNILLIPFFGFEIAALTTFICFMYIGYAGFFTSEFKKLSNENYYPLFWFTITIFLVLTAIFTVDLSLTYKLAISFVFIFSIITSFILIFSRKHD